MLEPRYRTAFTLYPYERTRDQDAASPVRHPVVVVGGGPVGMALALDLGRRGTPALVLDDHDGVGTGSRAICFAQRTLDIADRLGCGKRLRDKGIVWNVGRVFHGEREVFAFDLAPEGGTRNPAFVNLQQTYVERFLVEQVRSEQARGAPIEIRGCNRVVGLESGGSGHDGGGVRLDIDTPDGPYRLEADWVIACDGARSPVRDLLGLGFEGRVFEDNFLIADVRMQAPFPTERWFWFEPPFEGAGQSALLHKQPDDVWRLDFQLGWNIDRAAELAPAKVRARVSGMLGDGVDYELDWTSIYTFQCRRMARFRHGRVLFAGDSAHQVSPFGARGANSGFQDADNLGWKLDLVVRGAAPDTLLDSYDAERAHGADENILHSSRATDFLTPKSATSRRFRDAVLGLAGEHAFARPLINSGRLSVPCVYDGLPLNGPDGLPGGPAGTRVGAACRDAPLGEGFLLERLGEGFTLLCIDTGADAPRGGAAPEPDVGGASGRTTVVDGVRVRRLDVSTADDPSGALAERYLGSARSAVYLIRPDQHVAARWSRLDAGAVRAALLVASGRADRPEHPQDEQGASDASSTPSAPVASAAAAELQNGTVARLTRTPNIDDPDGFYDELLQACDGLDDEAAAAFEARLILTLCNQIGERSVLREALAVARGERAPAAGASLADPVPSGG